MHFLLLFIIFIQLFTVFCFNNESYESNVGSNSTLHFQIEKQLREAENLVLQKTLKVFPN